MYVLLESGDVLHHQAGAQITAISANTVFVCGLGIYIYIYISIHMYMYYDYII